MKLKSLKPRLHNIVFHTHTVSGIVISFALYICFFAGAIALFMDELYQWENPSARIEIVDPGDVNYNNVITSIRKHIPTFEASEQFGIVPPNQQNPTIQFYGSFKKGGENERFNAVVHPKTYEVLSSGIEPKTHMARTLYELHYFHQIPVVGIYLSGLVALFFLFAIITGLLTHWKNILKKFYAFTKEGKWKQIWTNSHISLGFIALPFQMIYAITGSLLGLSLLLLAPSALLLFDGETDEVIKAIRPDAGIKYDKDAKLISGIDFNNVYHEIVKNYPDTKVTYLYAYNYGKEDGTITARVDDLKSIGGDGMFVYSYQEGKLIAAIPPLKKTYAEGTFGVLIKLHYATYGGFFLKLIYFILAMITCYIIISGVLIWQTARDNKRYSEKQKRFHLRTTKIYLAICFYLLPAVGVIFLANKLVSWDLENRTFYVNTIFFISWLILSIIGYIQKDLKKLTQLCLLLTVVAGFSIPIVNGFITDDWFWQTRETLPYVFSVDVCWIIIGSLSFYLYSKVKSKS